MVLPRGVHLLSLQKPRGEAAGAALTSRRFRTRWYHRNELPRAPAPAPSDPRERRPRRFAKRAGGGRGSDRTPLVLLVDRATASSAEVFAGALAHVGGAVVIGEPTYGKGSSQALVYLNDGYAARFTAYTLAVGRGGAHGLAPLGAGVTPHVRWRWRSTHASRAANDEEVARAVASARAEL